MGQGWAGSCGTLGSVWGQMPGSERVARGSGRAEERGAHGARLQHGSAAPGRGQGMLWPRLGWIRASGLVSPCLVPTGAMVGTGAGIGIGAGAGTAPSHRSPWLSSGLAPAALRSLITAAQPADLVLNPSACNRLCSPEPGRVARGPVPAAGCGSPGCAMPCRAIVPGCATLRVPSRAML